MSRWHLHRSLHVRVTGLFLLLLSVSAGGYFLWVDATVFQTRGDQEADRWWSESQETEIEDLAASAETALARPEELRRLLAEFGERVTSFGAEVAVIDRTGRILATTQPDTLTAAFAELALDLDLIAEMAGPQWDFETYPDPTNIDSYANRIFEVAELTPAGARETTAWLVATFTTTITAEEVTIGKRTLWLQAIAVGLITAAVSGILAMLWLSRRLRVLSRGVASFAAGNLGQRVSDRSTDEIGRLGRDFNTMAERLDHLIGDLRNKERFQRQLIANISHDLRTPMASLRGYVETLALRGRDMGTTEIRDYVGIITSNLDHLDRLVEHLLQLSRLDAGQARFRMEDFPLPELLDGVIERCAPLARAKGISLRAESPVDLPLVHADPLQIAQVMQNLVDNGIKFNERDGEVVVVLAREADGVRVTVQDDGAGITAEVLPHVFERFFAGDESRSRKGESNGLGLAISQKIVHEHGGKITVESEPGLGTAFSFWLAAARGKKPRAMRAEG